VLMPYPFKLSKSIFDKAFDKEASQYYGLSIQCSLDGFSFCIIDPQSKKYLGLVNYDLQHIIGYQMLSQAIDELIRNDELLKRPYESNRIIFETHKSTLVPHAFFDPDNLTSYVKLHHQIDHDEVVRSDNLPVLEAGNVWLIPDNIRKVLGTRFPMAAVHNHASVLIESLLALSKNRDEGNAVFVYVRRNMFDIVVLNGNKLLFYNSFRYAAKEDFVYFLIYVLEQLELNPEMVKLTFLGEILRLSSIYDVAHKYVRHVGFGTRPLDFKYSYVFDDIPEHFYFNLLNHFRCEL
jgi:hypothetical protein